MYDYLYDLYVFVLFLRIRRTLIYVIRIRAPTGRRASTHRVIIIACVPATGKGRTAVGFEVHAPTLPACVSFAANTY